MDRAERARPRRPRVGGIAEAVFARALSVNPTSAAAAATPSDARRAWDRQPTATPSSTTSGRRALRLEGRRLRAGLRRDRRRRRAVRLGHRQGRDRHDLARRLHHPRALPQPDHRGLRREPRRSRPCSSTRTSPDAVAEGAGRVAPRRRACGGGGHPDPGVLVLAGLLRRPARRSGCPPRSSRASATSSARTPTSGSTPKARSTRSGPATAPRWGGSGGSCTEPACTQSR